MIEVGCTFEMSHAYERDITNSRANFNDNAFLYVLLEGQVSEWEHISNEEMQPTLKEFRKEIERNLRNIDQIEELSIEFDLCDEPMDYNRFSKVKRRNDSELTREDVQKKWRL